MNAPSKFISFLERYFSEKQNEFFLISKSKQIITTLAFQEPEIETVDVRLEKPVSGSFGLSLPTVAGGTGVYVRSITEGSVAAADGRLRVGDRLNWVSFCCYTI